MDTAGIDRVPEKLTAFLNPSSVHGKKIVARLAELRVAHAVNSVTTRKPSLIAHYGAPTQPIRAQGKSEVYILLSLIEQAIATRKSE
jgi:hypothetical protein